MLDPLQERIARVALAMPGAESLALAGGGAMLAHRLVKRPTQDVDMFTPEDVPALADALLAVLESDGLLVIVEAYTSTDVRLTVTESSGPCKVELARDARIRPPVRLDVGAVLHQEEIAADKMLALFGRAAARDFVDVAALLRTFPAERLLDLAAEKDPGSTGATSRQRSAPSTDSTTRTSPRSDSPAPTSPRSATRPAHERERLKPTAICRERTARGPDQPGSGSRSATYGGGARLRSAGDAA